MKEIKETKTEKQKDRKTERHNNRMKEAKETKIVRQKDGVKSVFGGKFRSKRLKEIKDQTNREKERKKE